MGAVASRFRRTTIALISVPYLCVRRPEQFLLKVAHPRIQHGTMICDACQHPAKYPESITQLTFCNLLETPSV